MSRLCPIAVVVSTLFAVTFGGCGGSAFTSAPPGDGGTNAFDAGIDAPVRRGTHCGQGLTCVGEPQQQGTICCLPNPPAAPACAAESCGCNALQLDCWRDADCTGPTPICCLHGNPACSGTALGECVGVGKCTASGGRELCDPSDPQSCPGTCSDNVTCTPLPTNQGYGVCGGC